ncbi:hypothetical protein ABZP36_024409 [Zizania latifolia]
MTEFRTLDFTKHDIISNINEGNMIDRGGSRKVYHIHHTAKKATGRSSTPRTVDVKKIGNAGKLDAILDKEFESEVRMLSDLQHNIIDLLCCISSQETKLLIYEHMENGSLDQWLRCLKRAGKFGPLDWPTRLSIAVDIARGLSYMHDGPVIHRGIKCSSILLDCKLRAKIADFRLARILAKSSESESASTVCGTFEYIAPAAVQHIARQQAPSDGQEDGGGRSAGGIRGCAGHDGWGSSGSGIRGA